MVGVAFRLAAYRVAFALKDKAGTRAPYLPRRGRHRRGALGAMLPGLAPTIEAAGETTTIVLHVPAGVHVAVSRSRAGIVLEARGLTPPKPAAQTASARPS